MMHAFELILPLIGLIVTSKAVSYGAEALVGTYNLTFIRESYATLTVPGLEQPNTGFTMIYAGVMTDTSNEFFGMAFTYWDENGSDPCAGHGNTWCAASATHSSNNGYILTGGAQGPAAYDSSVLMHYVYNDTTGESTETVFVNGQAVSIFSESVGRGITWIATIECNTSPTCSQVPPHLWTDIYIALDFPDPQFGQSFQTHDVGTGSPYLPSGPPYTSDGGLTWRIDQLVMPAATFPTPSSSSAAAAAPSSTSTPPPSSTSDSAASSASPSSPASTSAPAAPPSYGPPSS